MQTQEQPLDTLSSEEIVTRIVAEDAQVAAKVAAERAKIAALADVVVERMERGGRLIYIGAGTSGRLGVLDAAECPPTFGVDPSQVVGLIAGGKDALVASQEGAEDDEAAAEQDLAAIELNANDVVLGIAASGSTPYVAAGLRYARRVGAFPAALTCRMPAPIAELAEITIAPLVGPEIVRGSTRMKAGTAQKLVLNTLSTTVMIRLGHVFGNLMVDVQPLNAKLRRRIQQIVQEATGLDEQSVLSLLKEADGQAPVAIVMGLTGLSADEARQRLAANGGRIRPAIENI
jgi:N-acetylmuramic acid 6-phosphate etherase